MCGGGGHSATMHTILTKHLLAQKMKNFDFMVDIFLSAISINCLPRLTRVALDLGKSQYLTFIRRTTVITHSKLLTLLHFAKNQFQNFFSLQRKVKSALL